jgi:hypothetical protein
LSAMVRRSYRLTPRALPGGSVDSASMRVAFGSGHAGFALEEGRIAEWAGLDREPLHNSEGTP